MSGSQANLFEGEATKPVGDIVLHTQPGRPLTKAQQAFNRLVAKVEKLRAKLERERRRLDEALAYYGTHLHPRHAQLAELRKEAVRLLAPYLDDKRLKAKGDREMLRRMIAMQLDEIAGVDGGLSEPDLQALLERVHGKTAEQMDAEGLDGMRSAMAEIFREMGLDVDLTGFRPGMSDAEMAAAAANLAERMQQAADGRGAPPPRRKTKRQLEKEERARLAEELRRKSIASIYKQLAKVLHPDREQDPERKQRKSALMQELTTAYHNNDLHTLLRLELEWIHREEADLARLTDEKLTIYNQLLKEQVAGLELEVDDLPLNPRYRPIVTPDGPFSVRIQTDGPSEAYRLDLVIQSIEDSVARLRSPHALQEVRGALQAYRATLRAGF